MTEADVKIEKEIDINEIKDSAVGIGEAAGTGEPIPYHLRMPVRGKPREEWPVATFYLHPFDLRIAGWIKDQGVSPDPGIKDLGEISRQNRLLSQRIIDKGRGWSNLYRVDGTKWNYQPCPKDADGTDADPRVQLSDLGAFFGLIKARAISIAFVASAEIEGNSESSSVTPMDVKVEPNVAPKVSPDN